jgi:hypothetical protein
MWSFGTDGTKSDALTTSLLTRAASIRARMGSVLTAGGTSTFNVSANIAIPLWIKERFDFPASKT